MKMSRDDLVGITIASTLVATAVIVWVIWVSIGVWETRQSFIVHEKEQRLDNKTICEALTELNEKVLGEDGKTFWLKD